MVSRRRARSKTQQGDGTGDSPRPRLRAENSLHDAAEGPGQFHPPSQHDEDDALDIAVGDQTVIDGVVGKRDIAGGVVTLGIAKAALQYEHSFEAFMRVRRNGGSAPEIGRGGDRWRVEIDLASSRLSFCICRWEATSTAKGSLRAPAA